MPTSTDSTPLFSTKSFVKADHRGADNYVVKRKPTPDTPLSCPPGLSSAFCHTGIGKAGSHASSQDHAFLSVDKEMNRLLQRGSGATMWHHGIKEAGHRDSSDDRSFASSSLSSISGWKSSGKKSVADKLKEKIGSKWEARNQRISLYEAWQRKLPTLSKETTSK